MIRPCLPTTHTSSLTITAAHSGARKLKLIGVIWSELRPPVSVVHCRLYATPLSPCLPTAIPELALVMNTLRKSTLPGTFGTCCQSFSAGGACAFEVLAPSQPNVVASITRHAKIAPSHTLFDA